MGGGGANGDIIRHLLKAYGYAIAFSVDSRAQSLNLSRSTEEEVFPPEVLSNRHNDYDLIIVAVKNVTYVLQIDSWLDSHGFAKDIDYINLLLDSEINDEDNIIVDQTLGYSVNYKNTDSFNIYGDASKPPIVLLGNCTTYKISNKYFWQDVLLQRIQNHYSILDGACPGTCQIRSF